METETHGQDSDHDAGQRSPKRARLDSPVALPGEREKGVASIKAEYRAPVPSTHSSNGHVVDDDAAEGARRPDGTSQRKKQRGQNKSRPRGTATNLRGLCSTRILQPEFSPLECSYGDKCRYGHDVRKYLKECKRENLSSFGGKCPVWESRGFCPAGWACRFVDSHMQEVQTIDGRPELRLVTRDDNVAPEKAIHGGIDAGMCNSIGAAERTSLAKRNFKTPKSEGTVRWLSEASRAPDQDQAPNDDNDSKDTTDKATGIEDHRAQFSDPPFLPSEKRKIYFGPETLTLAPLTTQGNLPYRRLCIELGAQLTYSEMAVSLPLIQGQRSEWALMRAHESEIKPPMLETGAKPIPQGYDNSKDMRFGAQIAGNKPWNVVQATETLTSLCPHLRVIDLNCGCPIDLIFRQGSGSALLDSHSKLEKMLFGMNAVSGDVPVTMKIRTGNRDDRPTAEKLINRMLYGSKESQIRSGVAAITLHGRSRQQRYTRSANWEYIATCASLVKQYQQAGDSLSDTIREADARYGPSAGQVYFLGNGDCYSHTDYFEHLEKAQVDTVMIGRGALVKPWIFEEIAAGQYLDKSATERLGLVEKYTRYGLEAWGSDEKGVALTRRFLLEWLSFAHRYVPIAILERLPPRLNERPPAWVGRNELETLLASSNYKDWIKISEMFLGAAGDDFKFQPKHKSNSYEIVAEG